MNYLPYTVPFRLGAPLLDVAPHDERHGCRGNAYDDNAVDVVSMLWLERLRLAVALCLTIIWMAHFYGRLDASDGNDEAEERAISILSHSSCIFPSLFALAAYMFQQGARLHYSLRRTTAATTCCRDLSWWYLCVPEGLVWMTAIGITCFTPVDCAISVFMGCTLAMACAGFVVNLSLVLRFYNSNDAHEEDKERNFFVQNSDNNNMICHVV